MNKNRIIALLLIMNVSLLAVVVGTELGWIRSANVSMPAFGAPVASQQSPIDKRRSEIVIAAEKVSPAIVTVGATQTGYGIHPFADFFSDFAIYPYQQRMPYLGSGVIISSDGLVVTNHHVIEQAQEVFVTLMDGREFAAEVVDADVVLDVALLRLKNAKDLPTVKIGDSNGLMVGEWVMAMGNPFGNLIDDPHPSVTVGVVSAVKRSFSPNREIKRVYQDMIQTDAAINPGNSGGALVNAAGELVGINTFIMSRSGGAEGIGFAIPVNRVKIIVEEILTHGKIRSRLMDVSVVNATPQIIKRLGAEAAKGAVVAEIARGGPAQAGGLKEGDIVTKIGDRVIKNADDFMLNVWTHPAGTVLKMVVDRGGKKMDFEYEVTEANERR